MNFLTLIQNSQNNLNKIEPKQRGRKPKIQSAQDDVVVDSLYRPAGWKENGLDFVETISIFENLNKKKKDLTEQELIIAHNYDILKSCYRTPKYILNLAKQFIGEFNFDAFYNNYGFTNSGKEDFKTLSGYSSEDDGFNLYNWKRITANLNQPVGFKNPPFNRLEEAAQVIDSYIEEDKKQSRIAFLTTLDYTNYLANCFRNADYFLMLGRVAFLGMPGIKTSTPRGSVGMVIYNSLLDIGNSRFIQFDGNLYYCVDLRKERNTLNLKQLTLDYETKNP